MKVIMVCDTPPYGHALTYQISLTISKNKNVMARTRTYYLKNKYLTLDSRSALKNRNFVEDLPTVQVISEKKRFETFFP
jgi:hypothetical protein